MSDITELTKQAVLALEAAKVACDAAGFSVSGSSIHYSEGDVLARIVGFAKERVESEERRAPPVEIGDYISIVPCCGIAQSGSPRTRDVPRKARIVEVGRVYLYVSMGGLHREAFDLVRGDEKDGCGNWRVHPDDLFRVQRDLANRKRGKKS